MHQPFQVQPNTIFLFHKKPTTPKITVKSDLYQNIAEKETSKQTPIEPATSAVEEPIEDSSVNLLAAPAVTSTPEQGLTHRTTQSTS